MKHSKLRKWLVLAALIIFVQNGAIIMQSTGDAVETGSEGGITPYSDFPEQDVTHS